MTCCPRRGFNEAADLSPRIAAVLALTTPVRLRSFNEAADLSPRIGRHRMDCDTGDSISFNEAADLSPRIDGFVPGESAPFARASMRPRI